MIEGFLLGLSTGTYCLMTCVPLALPSLLAEPGTVRRSLWRVGLFMLGRLLAYVAVGLLLGWLGSYVAGFVDPLHSRRLQLVSWLVSGTTLTLAGLWYNFPRPRLCALVGRFWTVERGCFLLGMAAGLSICPPFVAAASRLFGLSVQAGGSGASLGGALSGALFFILFYLGASVYLLPLALSGLLPRLASARALAFMQRLARGTMLLLGLYFLVIEALLRLLTGAWG